MEKIAERPIRTEWMFEVRSACQSFHCTACHADRAQFESALKWLWESAPAPESLQEAEALKDRLEMCAIEAGTAFHHAYHARSPHAHCVGSPVEATLHFWAAYHIDPRVMLRRWSEAFLSAFDTTHPSSAAERAAAILRARFRTALDLDALATDTGACRSALTRHFRACYGMSCGEYLTRVKLRWFIDEVRKPGSNAGRLAEEAGYNRYHNLLDALRRRTGLTPAEVLHLPDNEVRELFELKLRLRPADLRTAR
jgi:AraC-like DNA-binding protein